MKAARAIVVAAIGAAVSGFALWAEDMPVATAPGDQGLRLEVVSDAVGGAIVVWQDRRLSLVFARRIDGSGERLWDPAPQPATSDHEKLGPAAVEDTSGGAIVTWYEGRSGFCTAGFAGDCDIYAQRFSASGMRLWGASGVPVTLAEHNQGVSGIALASDGAGGAFAAWEDARGDCCKVYAQHVAADGSPVWATDGIRLSPEPTIVFGPMFGPPQVVADGEGGVIVAWIENQVNPSTEIPPLTVQRIDADGDIRWPEDGVRVGVPVFTTFSLAADGAGGAYLAYTADTDDDFGEMSVQHVSANGLPLWGDNGMAVGATSYYAEAPDIIADGEGGAIVAWVDHHYDPAANNEGADILAQRVDAGGNRLWGPSAKPISTLAGDQDNPRALGDGSGGAIFVWRDCRDYLDRIECFFGSDVYGQHVAADGTSLWPAGGAPVSAAPGAQGVAQGTPTGPSFLHMASDLAGGAIVAWPDGRRGGCQNAIFTTECDVFAQRINSTPPEPSCGDPSGDGRIAAGDALIALNAAVGLMTCALAYCDVNASGAITAGDALGILSAAIGLPVELVCPVAALTGEAARVRGTAG